MTLRKFNLIRPFTSIFVWKRLKISEPNEYQAFVNYLSFLANRAMLEKEGVDVDLFVSEAAKRLANVPAMVEMADRRMKSRAEADYRHQPTATLGTWRNFWGSRVEYFKANGMPTQLVDFVTGLLDSAIEQGGDGKKAHADADVTRLQEVVRYKK